MVWLLEGENMEKYSSWTNRETWLVNLHFEMTTKEDVKFVKENMEEIFDTNGKDNLFLRDVFSTFESRINWQELEDHMEEDKMEE
jgi:hypothetical protein